MLFQENAIKYSFYALLLCTLANTLYVIYQFGIKNFIIYFLTIPKYANGFYQYGSTIQTLGMKMEVHDATFAFGFYFLFFLLFDSKEKYRKQFIILSILGMYLGLKRLQLIAIIIAIIFYILFENNHKRNYLMLTRFTFILTLIISFIYIYIMKDFTSLLMIFDNSRSILYNFLKNWISFSPFQVGKGFGFVNMYLESYGSLYRIGEYGKGLLPVSHSDLVRMYIELGLVTFCIWLYSYCCIIPRKLAIRHGQNVIDIYLVMLVYLLVTYLIDNTLILFATQYTFILIPISFISFERIDRKHKISLKL
jgi:hypothetical protein